MPIRSAWTASSSSSTPPPQPQALGHVLEMMGFRPVARHRSREVLLYRQGGVEHHRQRAPGRSGPRIARRRYADHQRRRAARARCARTRITACSIAARGRCPRIRRRWSSTSRHPRRRRQPHLLRRPLPRVLDLRRRLRSASRASIRIRRRLPGCTGSASSSTSGRAALSTGSSSTASCSAPRSFRTSSASASCRRASCCERRRSKPPTRSCCS